MTYVEALGLTPKIPLRDLPSKAPLVPWKLALFQSGLTILSKGEVFCGREDNCQHDLMENVQPLNIL